MININIYRKLHFKLNLFQVKLFDKKILDYDYGDDEEEMLNQSPEFQQHQHQNTAIEGLDRFVFFNYYFN